MQYLYRWHSGRAEKLWCRFVGGFKNRLRLPVLLFRVYGEQCKLTLLRRLSWPSLAYMRTKMA